MSNHEMDIVGKFIRGELEPGKYVVIMDRPIDRRNFAMHPMVRIGGKDPDRAATIKVDTVNFIVTEGKTMIRYIPLAIANEKIKGVEISGYQFRVSYPELLWPLFHLARELESMCRNQGKN